MAENSSVLIPLTITQPPGCSVPMLTGVQTSPLHGTITDITLTSVRYTPDPHFVGIDSVQLNVITARSEVATRSIALSVTSTRAEFAGNAEALFEYREQLTPNEVRHLLCKFALCGNPALYQIGITQGRRALVSALKNYDSSSLTSSARTRTIQLLGTTPEEHAIARASESTQRCGDSTTGYNVWSPWGAQQYWLDLLKNGSPLREHIALHLHNHLPVNFGSNQNQGLGGGCASHYTFKNYVDLLRNTALGRTPSVPGETPITGDFRDLLRNITRDYQMSLFLSQFQPRVLGSDGFWRWHVGAHNNNFARELLQVFGLGSLNVFTGQPNYTENDVQSVARALAGLTDPGWEHLASAPELQTQPWKLPPTGQQYGGLSRWESTARDTGVKTIFEEQSSPLVRRSGDLRPEDVFQSIEHHSGYAYVPRMLFARSVYPNPSTPLVHALDTEFRGSVGHRIPDFYDRLMNSSAAFSPEARYGCIASGAEHLLRLLNTLDVNVSSRGAPIPQNSYPFLNSTYEFIAQRLTELDHSVLFAPSIFGYGECGDTGGGPNEYNYGQGWLGTQRMLARYNLPFRTMKFYLEGEYPWMYPQPQEGFSIQSLLPAGNTSPTPEQIVDHFANRFGVSLSTTERTIALQFVRGGVGTNRPSWDPSNLQILKARLSGLVAIFANLPQVNVR